MDKPKLKEILENLYSDGSYDEEFPSKEAKNRIAQAEAEILALFKPQFTEAQS